MIAYEDLIVALSSWRAGQGLPANTVSFLSSTGGSVDLALPVADLAQNVGTGEQHAQGDEYAMDEVAVDDYVVDEVGLEGVAVDEYALDEAAIDEAAIDEAAIEEEYSAVDHGDEAKLPAVDEDVTMHTSSFDEGDGEQTAIATSFEEVGFGESPPAMPPDLAAPEEHEAIAMDFEQSEEIAADNLEVEEIAIAASDDESHMEELDILGEEDIGDAQDDPTSLGDLEEEATEMVPGFDHLRAPRPLDDPEE